VTLALFAGLVALGGLVVLGVVARGAVVLLGSGRAIELHPRTLLPT